MRLRCENRDRMSNLLFRTWNSLAVCSFYETRSPFSGANIRTYTVHLSIWIRASRHYVWRVSEHTCCYHRNFPVSFSFFFSFEKEELGEGVRLFFEQIFYSLICTTLKCYQTLNSNTYTLLQQGKKRNRYFLGNSTWFKPKKCMKIKLAEKRMSP